MKKNNKYTIGTVTFIGTKSDEQADKDIIKFIVYDYLRRHELIGYGPNPNKEPSRDKSKNGKF